MHSEHRSIDKMRRRSTVMRNNLVHKIHKDFMDSLGEVGKVVSKSYVYDHIKAKTALSTKTIAYILNHTIENEILD